MPATFDPKPGKFLYYIIAWKPEDAPKDYLLCCPYPRWVSLSPILRSPFCCRPMKTPLLYTSTLLCAPVPGEVRQQWLSDFNVGGADSSRFLRRAHL